MVELWIPCLPVAQPRQRHSVVAGHVRNYTPKDHPVNAFKATIRVAYRNECQEVRDGPIGLDLRFNMPRTKSMMWKKKPMPTVPHVKKPDLDNLAKAVLDALNGIAWRDDSQICQLMMSKYIVRGEDQPGLYLILDECI